MPATFRVEELESVASDTGQPDMVNRNALTLEDDLTDHSTSGTTDSDTGSSRSAVFTNEQAGSSIICLPESDTKWKNSSPSEDDLTEIQATHAVDIDDESKITYTFDDSGSSTTTSEDSDDDEGTRPTRSRPPSSSEPEAPDKPNKKPPPFEADPVRYVLGMKLPIADTGFCACNHVISSYATVFFIVCYATILILDSCIEVTPVFRVIYAYKYELFFKKNVQYVMHGWSGVFLLISAFVLWLATYRKSRPTLMVWMLVMLVYVLASLVLWLLGMLLSFVTDGWNTHSTAAASAGIMDICMEFYLLHMIYSYNRFMFEKSPRLDYYEPRNAALRQLELERLGLREVNIMGIAIAAPIPRPDYETWRKEQQVTSV